MKGKKKLPSLKDHPSCTTRHPVTSVGGGKGYQSFSLKFGLKNTVKVVGIVCTNFQLILAALCNSIKSTASTNRNKNNDIPPPTMAWRCGLSCLNLSQIWLFLSVRHEKNGTSRKLRIYHNFGLSRNSQKYR